MQVQLEMGVVFHFVVFFEAFLINCSYNFILKYSRIGISNLSNGKVFHAPCDTPPERTGVQMVHRRKGQVRYEIDESAVLKDG